MIVYALGFTAEVVLRWGEIPSKGKARRKLRIDKLIFKMARFHFESPRTGFSPSPFLFLGPECGTFILFSFSNNRKSHQH
jgi:hypothetical protein